MENILLLLGEREEIRRRFPGVDLKKIDAILICYFRDGISYIEDISSVIKEIIFQEDLEALNYILGKRGYELVTKEGSAICSREELNNIREITTAIKGGYEMYDEKKIDIVINAAKYSLVGKGIDSNAVDEALANVKERLKKGDKEYEDTHVLSDIAGKDMQEEILDLIGYFVVAAVRHLQVVEKFRPELNRVHFDKFIPEQRTDFIAMLFLKSAEELLKRKEFPFADFAKVVARYKDSSESIVRAIKGNEGEENKG